MRMKAFRHHRGQSRPTNRPTETLGHLQMSIEPHGTGFSCNETNTGGTPHALRQRLEAARAEHRQVPSGGEVEPFADRKPRIACKARTDNPR